MSPAAGSRIDRTCRPVLVIRGTVEAERAGECDLTWVAQSTCWPRWSWPRGAPGVVFAGGAAVAWRLSVGLRVLVAVVGRWVAGGGSARSVQCDRARWAVWPRSRACGCLGVFGSVRVDARKSLMRRVASVLSQPASRSASEQTATVCMPSSRHARMIRSAISPRLAIRIRENIAVVLMRLAQPGTAADHTRPLHRCLPAAPRFCRSSRPLSRS